MNPSFRKYAQSDVTAVVKLMAQLGYAHDEKSLKENVKLMREKGGEVFVAELSGRVCGCVSVVIDVRLAGGVNGEIASLIVDEATRGKGVGRGLVVTAEEWLQSRVQNIRVRSNVVRRQAHEFYKSMGYFMLKEQAMFGKDASTKTP